MGPLTLLALARPGWFRLSDSLAVLVLVYKCNGALAPTPRRSVSRCRS